MMNDTFSNRLNNAMLFKKRFAPMGQNWIIQCL